GTTGARLGSGPAPGTAWVSRAMANSLGLRTGSTLTVHTNPALTLRVGRVVSNPLVSFLNGNLKPGDSLLVPPGTVLGVADRAPNAVFPRWLTMVVGEHADAKAAPVEAEVESLRAALTRLVTPFNGDVAMVRADALRAAIAGGQSTGGSLTTIGAFGIIAGILLLVNVLLMLAEERLAELGTMRAVGMSRGPLIGSFTLEGAMYGAVGAFVGGGVGVLLGRLLVTLVQGDTAGSPVGTYRGLTLIFSVKGSTIALGIAAGFLIAALAVIGTSYRVSRLDVIRSLRGLPDQSGNRRRAAIPLLAFGVAIGVVLGADGWFAGAAIPLIVGVTIAFACAGALAARRYGWRTGTMVGCVPLTFFGLIFQVINPETRTNPVSSVVAGVVLVTAGVFLVNAWQGSVAGLLRRIGRGRAVLPTRLGLANPVAHRVRMLLTVGPFALVVFTLAYAEGLTNVINHELARTAPSIGGDYTLFAESSDVNPYDFSRVDDDAVSHIARTGTVFASFVFSPDQPPRFWPVTSFDAQFARVKPSPLISRDKSFATDADVYRAVSTNPDLFIADDDFLATFDGVGRGDDDPEPVAVGQTFTISSPVTGQARDITVAGVAYSDMFGQGAFYGETGLRALFGDQFRLTDAFMVAKGPLSTLVSDLEHDGLANGLEAHDVKETARAVFSGINDILKLFRADLGIGIIVGVAGIGVVLVRSVRDRRRQIGTLRAMGFDRGEIGGSFLVEGAFVAAQGLLVGVGFGYLTVLGATKGPIVVNVLGYEPALPAPTLTTVVLAIGLMVVAVAASAIPARAASRIPPAVALRLVD
ncbi:MAG: putative transport system permease protein, partial [Actinomycetota bacterium]